MLLFCLLLGGTAGVFELWTPSLPVQTARAFTPDDFDSFRAQERRRMQEMREISRAKAIYVRYGCDEGLAAPTAAFAIRANVPAAVVAADVVVESSCNKNAVSSAGAVGLMQIMPKIHHLDRRSLFDRETNLRAGTKILSDYAHTLGGLREGLRHYYGVIEGSTESDEYADHVLAVAYRRSR